MSETDYFVEYSKSGRAKCSFGKICNDKIEKGELRLGTHFERNDMHMTKYRHWRCVTKTILSHIGSSTNLGGFLDLSPEDQQMVENAFELGHVPDGLEIKKEKEKEELKKRKMEEKKATSKRSRGAAPNDESDEETEKKKPSPKRRKSKAQSSKAGEKE